MGPFNSICRLTGLCLISIVSACVSSVGDIPVNETALPTSNGRIDMVTDGSARQKPGLPLEPTRAITFTTNEGTWMALDVSPDGQTIVFDLLGDLYLLPIEGGQAIPLTSGMAFDHQPRFSPDGSQMMFVSDRGGSRNIWTIDLDTKSFRQVTDEYWVQLASPEWSPLGDAIYVTRYQYGNSNTAKRLNLTGDVRGEILRYQLSDPEDPQLITAGDDDAGRFHSGPAVTPDGDGLFLTYTTPQVVFSQFIDNRIAHLDLTSGSTEPVTPPDVRALRPRVSPDGERVAYLKDEGAAISLRLRNLKTGGERILVPHMGHARGIIAFDSIDFYPGFAFTPDGRSIVISGDGAIWRVDVETGERTQVPFTADVNLSLGPLIQASNTLRLPTVARDIRNAELSPDGSKVAFGAFGKVWIFDFETGATARVSSSSEVEDLPSWSPDGRRLAYSTWSPVHGGQVFLVPSDFSDAPRALTKVPAYFQKPAFSSDGSNIVIIRGTVDDGRQPKAASALTLGLISVERGAFQEIRRFEDKRIDGASLSFSEDGCRVFVTLTDRSAVTPSTASDTKRPADIGKGNSNQCDSENPNVQMIKVGSWSDVSRSINDFLPSPDGYSAFIIGSHGTYLVDFQSAISDYTTISLDDMIANGSASVRQISQTNGLPGSVTASWAAGGEWLQYAQGRRIVSYNLQEARSSWKEGLPYVPEEAEVVVEMNHHRSSAAMVLRGARLITMEDDAVIERGDIVVRGNEIVGVGPEGTVPIPHDATIMDVSGKTILPGFIDLHAHTWKNLGIYHDRMVPVETLSSPHLAYLSFGVTTIRDPGSSDLAYTDLAQTGLLVGPRVLSAQNVGIGARSFKGFERRIEEIAADNADQTAKFRTMGPRVNYQWVIKASRRAGLLGTAHVHSSVQGVTNIMDGYPGVEHYFGGDTYSNDLIQLIARSGTTYTPTLTPMVSGETGRFYVESDFSNEARLQRFIPPGVLERKEFSRTGGGQERQELHHATLMARNLVDIVEAGGRVGVGGHGDFWGLDFHIELRVFQSGGMAPVDILRSATQVGADAIGLGHELGSLEVGKLADLIVLDENPLEDIRNAASTNYVMRNGELYDADTLDKIWPTEEKLPDLWWWEEDTPYQPE